jgi:hypothetical protein
LKKDFDIGKSKSKIKYYEKWWFLGILSSLFAFVVFLALIIKFFIQ